ncbi:MAG: hypothetical protein R2695_12245 [Acidimicrobiales bacterium]
MELRPVRFASADGTDLVGDLLLPEDPSADAVVCHPHPLYGGTRHDAVVGALCRALTATRHRGCASTSGAPVRAAEPTVAVVPSSLISQPR